MMGGACRIIPVDGSVVNNQSDRKSPIPVGPLPNGHKKCLINWGDPISLPTSGGGPSSMGKSKGSPRFIIPQLPCVFRPIKRAGHFLRVY